MKFLDVKEVKKEGRWGPRESNYFWLQTPQTLEYREAKQIKLFCSFDFTSFPFDSHQCRLQFGSAVATNQSMILAPTKVHFRQQVLENSDDFLEVQQRQVPFDIRLETMESVHIWEMGSWYPIAGVSITLKRNTLGLLYGGFYGPTAFFAILSLISYTIHPDAVRYCH